MKQRKNPPVILHAGAANFHTDLLEVRVACAARTLQLASKSETRLSGDSLTNRGKKGADFAL